MSRIFKMMLAVAVLTGLVAVNQSYADLTNTATTHVRVVVSPNVSLSAVLPTIDAGTIQTGPFSAIIGFRVDANLQEVSFFVAASALYKGNDPTNSTVSPIPVDLGAGALIQPANGNATGGHSNTAAFIGSPGPVVQGFPTSVTETVQYSSSQNNHFSQNVNVTVGWIQNDPERPTGEYSGVVQLTAVVIPLTPLGGA